MAFPELQARRFQAAGAGRRRLCGLSSFKQAGGRLLIALLVKGAIFDFPVIGELIVHEVGEPLVETGRIGTEAFIRISILHFTTS
jgi:hypothetical protein